MIKYNIHTCTCSIVGSHLVHVVALFFRMLHAKALLSCFNMMINSLILYTHTHTYTHAHTHTHTHTQLWKVSVTWVPYPGVHSATCSHPGNRGFRLPRSSSSIRNSSPRYTCIYTLSVYYSIYMYIQSPRYTCTYMQSPKYYIHVHYTCTLYIHTVSQVYIIYMYVCMIVQSSNTVHFHLIIFPACKRGLRQQGRCWA